MNANLPQLAELLACRTVAARRGIVAVLLVMATTVLLFGCGREKTPPEVVVYTSVDEPFARDVLEQFTARTGIRVSGVYDSEAGKTSGLVRRIEREKDRPRCDVWWSSEAFGTIDLARAGLLAPYESPAAGDIDSAWKDAGHRWTGMAARARVLAFNTRRLKREDLPATWAELATPAWSTRLALANPQFGTTRGHVAALFAFWGEPAATSYLHVLHDSGTRIADGNGHAVRLVAAGEADVCWTDTDDVWVAQRNGQPIDLAYPHVGWAPPTNMVGRAQPADDAGDKIRATGDDHPASSRATDGGPSPPYPASDPVLWIPCTVALVRGAPNGTAATRLIDYLVSAEVERALAKSDSHNVPVRPTLRAELLANPDLHRFLAGPSPEPLDFERIADALPAAMKASREILLQ